MPGMGESTVSQAMRGEDLRLLYRVLRDELALAYAETPWDSERIDRIAQDLLAIERSMALLESGTETRVDTQGHTQDHTDLDSARRTDAETDTDASGRGCSAARRGPEQGGQYKLSA